MRSHALPNADQLLSQRIPHPVQDIACSRERAGAHNIDSRAAQPSDVLLACFRKWKAVRNIRRWEFQLRRGDADDFGRWGHIEGSVESLSICHDRIMKVGRGVVNLMIEIYKLSKRKELTRTLNFYEY
jgi:hypothetical protein